nr:hypothetical protein [uncultured Oribacterium sp.]
MINKIKKNIELFYPYILPIGITVPISLIHTNFLESENLNSALEAIITVSSLIIGFLGAILPVIMSMKNDSKIVKYVFEKDKEQLFLKYIKQTLLMGILVIMVALSIFIRDQYVGTIYYKYALYIIVYFLCAFLLCTYRSIDNMLDLIFSKDIDYFNDEKFHIVSEEEKEFRNRLNNEES